MEERFSSYLTEIGLLNETTSSSFIKKDDKSSNKSFADSSFQCLKNYFDNLDEEQKNYMSLCIPTKFISITDKIKRNKLKSIIIQLILRRKLLLFKYFWIWKANIILIDKYSYDNINSFNINNEKENQNNIDKNSRENIFNNNVNQMKDNEENSNINFDEYQDNISAYKIINIDRNIDVDNKHRTKTEEEQLSKNNKSNQNTQIFSNSMINDNTFPQDINKMKINSKNIKNLNKKYKSKEKKNIKTHSYRNKKILNKNNSQDSNNFYKTIKTNNMKKQNNNKSMYSTNNNSSYRNTTKTHLHTSLEEKELRELKECTFKPRINQSKKEIKKVLSQSDINSSLVLNNMNNISSINNLEYNKQKREEEIQKRFEKLYKDSEKYKMAKEMKILELEHMISRNAPFIPNLKRNDKGSLHKIRQKSEGNFEERQKEYLHKRNKHSAELKNKIDSDFEELCSFNPKITNEKGEYYKITNKEKISKKPVFVRLYEDCKDRKNFHIQKEVENLNKIMDLSNILNPQKNFNYETINRLYENKYKNDVIKKTKKKVEEDEGVTFHPYISENSNLLADSSNFYERNKKFLKDKESFYEKENIKFKNRFVNNAEKKEYTNEQRKQIIDNIINRLYNEAVHK